MKGEFITSHLELRVYQLAFESAMQLYQLSRQFPEEEKSLLTRQLVSASRSVCANMAEAWGKRRYRGAFLAKLNEAEAEAAEVRTWIAFAVRCAYLEAEMGQELQGTYREILKGLNRLVDNATAWVISME